MAIIINDPNAISVGGQMGQEWGQQLASPLQMLAQRKMQEIQHRYNTQNFMNMGYDPQTAAVLAPFQGDNQNLIKALELAGPPQYDQLNPIYRQLSTALPQQKQQQQPVQIAPQAMQQPQQGGYQPVYRPKQPVYPQQGPRMWPGKNGGKMQQAEYKQNYEENKKFFDDLRTSYSASKDVVRDARKALDILRTSRPRTGAAGYMGTFLGNEATRRLGAIYDSIALNRSASLRGPISVGKIRAAAATKPQLNMPLPAQIKMLEDMIADAEQGPIAQKQISDELYRLNGYKTLPGHQQRVQELYDQLYGNGEQGFNQPAGQQQPAGAMPMQNQQGNDETWLGTGVRNAVRLASRGVVEPILGGPGSLLSLAGYAGNKILGTPTYEQAQEAFTPLKLIPTAGQVEQGVNALTGGYTEPRGGVEEALDEITGTMGALLTPTLAREPLFRVLNRLGTPEKVSKGVLKTAKALSPFAPNLDVASAAKVAGAGLGSKKLVELLGGDAEEQMWGKMAGMALFGIRGTAGSIKDMKNKLYQEAEPGLKQASTQVNDVVNELERQSNQLQTSINEGQKDWGKSVGTMASELRMDSKNGRITLDKLQERYKQANVRYAEANAKNAKPEVEATKADIGKTKEILKNNMRKADVGREYVKKWEHANSLNENLEKLREAKEFLSDNFSPSGAWHKPVKMLFTDGLGKAIMAYGKLITNPIVLKNYRAALQAAAMKNKNAFIQAAGRLNAEVGKLQAQYK